VAAVAQLEELDEPAPAWSVGDEHLMAHPGDGVEQTQLGSGVRAFSTHDHPRAVGIAGQVNEVGDLGELGSVAQAAVGLDRVDPVHAGGDRGADRFRDRRADGEEAAHAIAAQAADVGQEPFRGTGRVRPDQDIVAVTVNVGDLDQCTVEDLDVIGGGVRTGPSGTQQPGQGLTGRVEETLCRGRHKKHSSGWNPYVVLLTELWIDRPDGRLSGCRRARYLCRDRNW
jgi:hypothetical protein